MNKIVKSLRKLYKGQGGFTLIELLVVVAILGVIAAVVILNVGGFIGSGTQEAANTEVHQVQTAAISCMAAANCSFLAGAIGPSSDATNCAGYLMNQGLLQATYTLDSTGKATNASLITGSKWTDCTFSAGTWTCP